jgi:hypothetical protein
MAERTEVRVLWRVAGSDSAFITAAPPNDEAQAQAWAEDWRNDGCEVRVQRRTVTTSPWAEASAHGQSEWPGMSPVGGDPLLESALADAMVEAAGRGATSDAIQRQTEAALKSAFRRIAREEEPHA